MFTAAVNKSPYLLVYMKALGILILFDMCQALWFEISHCFDLHLTDAEHFVTVALQFFFEEVYVHIFFPFLKGFACVYFLVKFY